MPSVLIDTNVLVYSVDRGEHPKQLRSIEILDRLQVSGSACLSIQCLAEFFRVTTRPLKNRLPMLTPDQASNQVEWLARAFVVFDLTLPVVREATRGVIEHQFSYYDSQIWAAAHLNQVPLVLSEDFQDRRLVEGVQFLNPFSIDFELTHWL
jgi:predicted nucleic acid-binding protein